MDFIKKLATRDLITIPYNSTIQDAARVMKDNQIGSLLVEKNGNIIGIFSETDVVRRAVANGLNSIEVNIETLITSPIISLDINSDPEEANDLMRDKKIRHLPLTENGKIVGIISVRDLLRFFRVYYKGIGSLKEGN